MDDLKERFSALGVSGMPALWGEIGRRASEPPTAARASGRGRRPLRALAAALAVGVSVIAVGWAIFELSRVRVPIDHPQPAATNVFTIPLPTKNLVVVPE